ncbi:MAG: M48 family metalloprotease [Acidobacteria bacterium]|nr:M48 family metalloprotease [Acidobacteriota bacterium]
MRKHFKLTAIIIFIIVLVFIIVQCAVNPVTGKKEIMLVSESMEIEMGKEIDKGIRQEYGLYYDPPLTGYVIQVGNKMVPYTHRPRLEYHFAILDTPVENAFAAPGGYIYITRGLMAMLNSEAEMATVIGHELGHVNARHSARQITRSILITLGIVLASELSDDIKKIAPVSMIAAELLFLKFSRSDEYQADELGIQYSLKSGYAAGEMVNFFNSLQRLSASGGGVHLPNFLSTHPMTPRRIDHIKELLATNGYTDHNNMAGLSVEKKGYLKKIDGLVFGADPRQGYEEGGIFYHPAMRFFFHPPAGWKTSNTPLQVTMAPEDGKAVIILKTEDTSESLDSYSQKMIKSLTNPKIIGQEFRYVNGLNAFHTLASFSTGQEETGAEKKSEEIKADLTFIRKENTVFTFFSAASTPDFSKYKQAIYRAINSFKPLKSIEHLNRQPQRIFLRQVNRSQSLRNFLLGQGVPQQNWDKIVIINSMDLEQQLAPNQLIKIIQ